MASYRPQRKINENGELVDLPLDADTLNGEKKADIIKGLAKKSDIPTNNNQLINGAGYIKNEPDAFDYDNLSNKPTIPPAYSLPTASSSIKGGIKVGDGLKITGETLSTDISKIVEDRARVQIAYTERVNLDNLLPQVDFSSNTENRYTVYNHLYNPIGGPRENMGTCGLIIFGYTDDNYTQILTDKNENSLWYRFIEGSIKQPWRKIVNHYNSAQYELLWSGSVADATVGISYDETALVEVNFSSAHIKCVCPITFGSGTFGCCALSESSNAIYVARIKRDHNRFYLEAIGYIQNGSFTNRRDSGDYRMTSIYKLKTSSF